MVSTVPAWTMCWHRCYCQQFVAAKPGRVVVDGGGDNEFVEPVLGGELVELRRGPWPRVPTNEHDSIARRASSSSRGPVARRCRRPAAGSWPGVPRTRLRELLLDAGEEPGEPRLRSRPRRR